MNLYVTDLDGTLLNSKEEISHESINIINELIEKGLNFSIATARSIYSAKEIIKPLNLQYPIILNNGAFIYDVNNKTNLVANFLTEDCLREVINTINEYNMSPLLFHIKMDGSNSIYYKGIFREGEKRFVEWRLAKGDKRFKEVNEFPEDIYSGIANMVISGLHEELEESYEVLKKRVDISIHFYYDIYIKLYNLEITNIMGTKRKALEFLKGYLKVDKLHCFGDNMNDASMFELADYSYAVANSNQELKKMATKIIGTNEENGVANFLKGLKAY
ncbi:MAG TPA: HAD family hydrolase [Clostridiaceae bacterium]